MMQFSARMCSGLLSLALTLASLGAFLATAPHLADGRRGSPAQVTAIRPATASADALIVPFIPNHGQLDARVAYYAPASLGSVYVTRDGLIVYSLSDADRKPSFPAGWTLTERLLTDRSLAPHSDAHAGAQVSWFVGADRHAWRSALPATTQVSLGEAWPGIAVSLEAHGGSIETFYHLAPGADAGRIRVGLGGASAIRMSGERLVADTGLGPMTLEAPRAWALHAGARRPVDVRYRLQGQAYGFALGPHDPSDEVVIDPVLQSTYLGPSGIGFMRTPTLDPGGDVYVTGVTDAMDFPGIAGGAQTVDRAHVVLSGTTYRRTIFIARLSGDLGTLLQATYLGGTKQDIPAAIAVGPSGDVYVAGLADSTDFPGTAGGAQATAGASGGTGFIARLSGDLTSLLQSTYLGGTQGASIARVAIDAAGDVYVAGNTKSSDIPGTTGGAQVASAGGEDAFVAKLSTDLTTLDQATYFGGSSSEQGTALVLDAAGDVYVAGSTASADLPGTTGAAQSAQAAPAGSPNAFVAKFSGDLTTLDQATYFGGSSSEQGTALVLDAAGDVYIAGTSLSSDVPGTTGGASPTSVGFDTFIAKLSSDLTTLDQATYLGIGTVKAGLVVDASDKLYIAGETDSTDLPGTARGAQPTNPTQDLANSDAGSDESVFVVRFDGGLTHIEKDTFLGGSIAQDFGGLALDAGGDLYVAGDTGSGNFPNTAGGAIADFPAGSSFNLFVTRMPASLDAYISPGAANDMLEIGDCVGFAGVLRAIGTGPLTFSMVKQPSLGSVDLSNTGYFTYSVQTSADEFDDSFVFSVTDGITTSTATESVSMESINNSCHGTDPGQPPPASGGGGGAFGPLLLMLLVFLRRMRG